MPDSSSPSPTSPPPPGVVLVGHGPWGRNLARVLSELGALRAVVDIDPARRPDAAHLPFATDLETLSPDVRAGLRAAVVAGPAAAHAAIGRTLLDRGLDLLVEKPLTTDLADARALVARAEARDRLLMVGHQILSHPAFRRLRELVSGAALGEIRAIRAERRGRGRLRPGEDVLLSFAPHDLAMILDLAGGPAAAIAPRCRRLEARSWTGSGGPDACRAELAFSGGPRVDLHVCWDDALRRRRLVVEGSLGLAVFDELDAEAPLRIFDAASPEGRVLPVEPEEPLRAHLRHFLASVARGDRDPGPAGARGALAVSRIIDSLRRAARRAQPAEPSRARSARMSSSSSRRSD